MKKQVIAIVFSDLHLNLWAKFNEDNKRTLNHFRVCRLYKSNVKSNNCPALFCGDFFHKPETMDQDLMELTYEKFKELELRENQVEIFSISGNHDLKKVSFIVINLFMG